MKYAAFQAVSPFEIGQRIMTPVTSEIRSPTWDGSITVIEGVKEHTITDIVCKHYLKTGETTFEYELDNSGQYVKILQIMGKWCK